MVLYKLIFAKGYNISLKWGLANSPETAAGHLHALMTILIGVNVVTALAFILLLSVGKNQAINFLTNGICWAVILGLTYWFVYIYFIWKKEYLSIAKNFYQYSKFKGKKGTIVAILFCIGSGLFLFGLTFYLSWDKF